MGILSDSETEQYEFRIRRSTDGQFYWTLHNTKGNVEPVATSERYTQKHNAQHAIDQVKRFANGASVNDLT